MPDAFPLSDAEPGQALRVQSIRAGKQLHRRLLALGLNIGTELQVTQRHGGALVVGFGAARLGIGLGMAQKILVTRP